MKTKYNIFYLLFCLVAFCGCTADDDYSSSMPETTGKEAYVAFDLAVPGQEFPTTATRAIENDAAINEYVIWIFQEEKFVKEIKSTETDKVVMRDKQLFVLLPESTVTLCMIANSTVKAPGVGTDKVTALKTVEVSIGENIQGQPNHMPMYGERTLEVKLGAKSTITLRRAMAKVELIISASAYDQFKLQHVKLLNINEKGYVCAEEANSGSSITYTHPIEDEDYIDNEIKFSCYIPEIADVNGSKRVSLLLAGTYGNEQIPTYYRLDFIAKDGSEIEDIKRNYRYTYVINHIQASGFSTEDDAIKAPNASNSAGIEGIGDGWIFMDEDIMDITTDGSFYLGVTSAEIIAGSEGNDEYYYANFSVVCNNTKKGWNMITTELPAGTTVSLVNYIPLEDEILKAISIWIYIEKDKVTSGDTESIYIYTGNIRKKIEIIIP